MTTAETVTGNPGELPVLIIGAGACGLAIAHGLQRANIPAIVFERDVDVRSRVGARDWAVACHWAGPILAKIIGEEKWSRIQEANVDPNMSVEDVRNQPPVKVLHAITCETLGEMVTGGEPFYRFLRSRLVAFLADGIDVRYSKTLDRFVCHPAEGPSQQGSVTAHFADGTEIKGSLLIGADGARSRVRSQLFEHDPKQADLDRLPYAATFFNASFTADQARSIRAAQRHPLGCAMLHPKGSINMVSILDATQAENPETWRFTFYASTQCSIEEQDREIPIHERVRDAKQMVRDDKMGDPIKTVFELVPADTVKAYYTKVANWDPSVPGHKWDNHDGLVTLTGDACHPMTHHRGQGKTNPETLKPHQDLTKLTGYIGLNHAIADAGRIVELLSSQGASSQKEIIENYEAEMVERGGKEVRLSALNSRMIHDWEAVMNSPLVTQGVKAK